MTAKVISKHTNQDYDKVIEDTERDNFLTAEDSVSYGLVDQVIYPGEKDKTEEDKD